MKHYKEFFIAWLAGSSVLLLFCWYAGVDFSSRGPIQAWSALGTLIGGLIFSLTSLPSPRIPKPRYVKRASLCVVEATFESAYLASEFEKTMDEYIG